MNRSEGPRRVVVLFTRDLRVHDNPGLTLALRSAAQAVPLFVFDPALAGPVNRLQFLLDCVTGLRSGLRSLGGDLAVRRGDPVAEAVQLARAVHAGGIVVASDVSGYARQRYRRLQAACQQHRLELREVDAHTVVPAGAVVPVGGDHYRVFTPYWRAWSRCRGRAPLPRPSHVPWPRGLDAGEIPALRDLTARFPSPSLPRGGEAAARQRMQRWLSTGLACYAAYRDDLPAAATSRLSADLHFGAVSAAELAAAVRHMPGGEAYLRQLCWRDFHAQVAAAFPGLAVRDYRPRRHDWRDDPGAQEAWCAGQTGLPIVDAGLRQLAREGYLPNRARLITAAALTRHLGIHWTIGERYFARLLVDGDLASNAGNWQWIAGTGNDTRPNRRFSLLRQAHRFDPAGDYVRRYVPELAGIDGAAVHEPWRLRAARYPPPLPQLGLGGDR